MFGRTRSVLVSALLLACLSGANANPRYFVLTDIGNEPDDQMSLVRLLLYANEIDIEGLVASTSTWKRDEVSPEMIAEVVDAYGEVVPNLRRHAAGWPDAQDLKALIRAGRASYGVAGMDPDDPSAGARFLLEAAQRDDPRPLWVGLWGGANTLGEALGYARNTLSPEKLDALVKKLRVYSISDQDDAGPWIRREFPKLFYIVSPSSPDGADYARATWTGIAGDVYYRNGAGADFTTVSNEWLNEHVRSQGPLGERYPEYLFIMEGDTPSYLGLIPTGLQSGDQPNWGGWGGRYLLRTPSGESRPVWTQGGDSFSRITSADDVGGYVSDQATIWRWREHFQHDFAARMAWTHKPYSDANHPPEIIVNDVGGFEPLEVTLAAGDSFLLDASSSRDPDDDRLAYSIYAYPEAGYSGSAPPAELGIDEIGPGRARVSVVARCAAAWFDWVECPQENTGHVIVAITDNGAPALTRYRRVVVTVHPGSD